MNMMKNVSGVCVVARMEDIGLLKRSVGRGRTGLIQSERLEGTSYKGKTEEEVGGEKRRQKRRQ